MIEVVAVTVVGAAILAALAVGLAVRRAKRRRGHNPSDIYPLW
jgi:hypothetical protein